MLEIRFRRTDNSLTLTGWGLSAGAVLGVLLASGYLVSLPHTLAQDKVDQVIRQYLRYQSSQQYAATAVERGVDPQSSDRYREEIRSIRNLNFEPLEVGRLLPDYFFNRTGPTSYARVVIRGDGDRRETLYLNLGTGELVVSESSRFIWLFVF